jgi:predicted transcriptional regulator
MGDEVSDVVAFFGSSPTRLTTLQALCEEAIPRAKLQERIDTSRITLWRLLGDFEDRGWVRETDAGYEATVAGRFVVEQLTSVEDALQALEELDGLLEWLPLDEMDFSLERLAEAEFVRPSPSDPQGPIRLATAQIREATTIRILTHGYAPRAVESMHELGMAGDQSGVLVTSTGVLETFLEEPSMREKLGELIEAERLEYFHHRGEVPHIFAILDGERVGMGVDDDDGRPQAAFDIDDETVLAWAERTFERYRSQSARVDPERFTG